ISITPIAFLSIRNGDVSVLPMISKPSTVDGLITSAPAIVDKVKEMFSKDAKKETAEPKAEIEVKTEAASSDDAVRDVLAELGVEDTSRHSR
ncbi:MAG: hypothetical protein IKI63_02820, partial [Clostridia bacterium]|nr:hypothetical protein [Clostridia bacterium]